MPARGSGVGAAEYFQSRIRIAETGCVEWTGYLTDDGYGKTVVGYRPNRGGVIRVFAHRFSFQMWRGEIPEGLDLDHLCRNRRCVNPDHLEPVTRKENVGRGLLPVLMKDASFAKRRPLLERCRNGHEMSGENIGRNSRRRWCRACKRDAASKSRKRKGQ